MAHDTIEISVKGKWVQAPALEVEGKKIFVSGKWLRVASIHQERFQESEIQDPHSCVAKLKARASNGMYADIFTFAQRLSATAPKYNYPMEWDSIAAVRTHSFKEWWEKLPQTPRKNVRRAQKRGVVITVEKFSDELVRGIADVNNDSTIRQGRENYHYGKSFEQVKRDHASFIDRSDFICAYVGDELIGFLKVVYAGDIALTLNLGVKPSHYDKKPANPLIGKAVELCEARGVSYLRYGMYNYGNKGDSSLRQFKINNGFEEILVPRFYVPLTMLGRFAIKAKLHRGLVGILPGSIVKPLVNLRAKWNNFRAGQYRRDPVNVH